MTPSGAGRRPTPRSAWSSLTLTVPLARRNLLADKRRLARSISGIAFAALLMMVELGFRNAFIDSMLLAVRQLDADILLVGRMKYEFGRDAPFPRRQLYQARALSGVASARPLYAERTTSLWRNPQTHQTYTVQVFAFDPDEPIFLLPEINANLAALRRPDTLMADRRARSFIGQAVSGTETELARRKIQVVGTFSLGPNFFADGTVIMSDRNFAKLLAGRGSGESQLPEVEVGVVKIRPGYSVPAVQQTLQAAMADDVSVLSKAELLDREAGFHARVSSVGPIFGVGVLVGFAVGMMISYQVMFADLADQQPQYATMKAMGYQNGTLIRIVLQQAVLYAIVGYIPAWILCVLIFRVLNEIALLPMEMSTWLTAVSFSLTALMCIASALVAARRVIAADPAEVF
jgi:putative ABC transport system permease protein